MKRTTEEWLWYATIVVLMIAPGCYMAWMTWKRAEYLSDYFGTDILTELLGRLFPAVVSLMMVILGMVSLVLVWKGGQRHE